MRIISEMRLFGDVGIRFGGQGVDLNSRISRDPDSSNNNFASTVDNGEIDANMVTIKPGLVRVGLSLYFKTESGHESIQFSSFFDYWGFILKVNKDGFIFHNNRLYKYNSDKQQFEVVRNSGA